MSNSTLDGMSGAGWSPNREIEMDRTIRLTTGILVALQRAIKQMQPEIEAIIRDELDEYRREILRERADLEEHARHD
jgi:hypothetical protein